MLGSGLEQGDPSASVRFALRAEAKELEDLDNGADNDEDEDEDEDEDDEDDEEGVLGVVGGRVELITNCFSGFCVGYCCAAVLRRISDKDKDRNFPKRLINCRV